MYPAPNNASNDAIRPIQVSSLSDFPAPIAGEIIISDAYRLIANVDVGGNVIKVAPGSKARITSSNIEVLSNTNPSGLFVSDEHTGFLLLDVVTLSAPKLFDISDPSKSGFIVMHKCIIYDCDDIGTVDDIALTIKFNEFDSCGQGLIANNNTRLSYIENDRSNSKNLAGTTVLSITGDQGIVSATDNFAAPGSNEAVLYIDPASTVKSGSIAGNRADLTDGGVVLATGSKDQTDIYWSMRGNAGIPDSTAKALINIGDNTLTTSIPASGALALVSSNTWEASKEERITVGSDGVATYSGINGATLSISGPHAIAPDQGTNKNLSLRIIQIIASTENVVTFTSATNLVNEIATERSNGDLISFYNSLGVLPSGLLKGVFYYVVNKLTDSFQLSYTEGGSPIAFTTDGTPENRYRIAEETGLTSTSNTDAGVPINTTVQGLADVNTGDNICSVASSDDGSDINVISGGLKITS